ncbi:GNAT family N-acetyltransferase [Metabacillus sediminilitoris]|uniref:GNAT family N-acetyltransferase n=1 Tax=Metabacillus sediminilitoris TaxID=2567941 RepID=UPI001454DD1B
MIERCKEEKNNSKLTVNSSPYALGIYHRLGFVESDKEQTINGIRFTPMSYFLM